MFLTILGAGLAGLATLPHGGGVLAQSTSSEITSDTYFYGESPPVYPSPNATGTGDWATAISKAAALVSQMTLAEKVSLTGGASAGNGCSGSIPAISRLNFPGLCLNDAGNGLREADFVSAWPSGMHVGASWNKDLTYQRGLGMGGEFKTKGVNILLGPVVGPLGRVTLSGRTWEGFSPDPYLSGGLVSETVTGIQESGVITSVKHFIANEQETNRSPSGGVESVSSNIDDVTIHELYLWPFQDAVHAGAANIMCSYNRVNNSHGCANSKTLNGLLKTELGFQGFVVSDWGAQHAGVATALAGLDVAMPSSGSFWGSNLVLAVQNGSVPESRVTDMATRIIAPWYYLGQDQDFPTPGYGLPSDYTKPHTIVDARDPAFFPVLRQGAVEGHVLVKNVNGTLPLNKPRMLNLFGYSAQSQAKYTEGVAITPTLAGTTQIYQNGTLYMGGGSGGANPWTAVAPFDALVMQAYNDGTALFWDFSSALPTAVDAATDACLVFVNSYAQEGYDRTTLNDAYTDNLILSVANHCGNTIVVIHNTGIRLVDAFADHPNVTAIIMAHGPGQASGLALVDLLYGTANPSGKLPYTMAHNASDYGTTLGPDLPEGEFALFPQSNFTEGVFLDYRRFDALGIEPRYEFGFGLSYTTFGFSDLTIGTPLASAADAGAYPTGPIAPGGQVDLWDVLLNVSATVTNTGSVSGAEVAQLYLALPSSSNSSSSSQPVRQLRGFEKPFLNASQSATVSFGLTRRDLSVWDVVAQNWKLQSGTYTISVGSSSRDLPLVGTVTL